MDEVPQRVNVRLDAETRAQLFKYMRANSATLSQAMRVLLAVSLRDEATSPEAAFRAAAFREGVIRGIALVRERLTTATTEAVQSALSDLEELDV